MQKNFSIFILSISILLIEFIPTKTFAQAGNLDSSFHFDGITGLTYWDTYGDTRAQSIAIQMDGKIVVAGFHKTGTYYAFALARYKTDGTLDSTFHSDGLVTTGFYASDSKAYSVAIQPDGKIVATGYCYHTVYGQNVFAVARYNTDGTLDATFNIDGMAFANFGSGDQNAYGVAVQADGKIVVAGTGTFNPTPVDNYICVARFTSTGSLDLTFSGNGLFSALTSGAGYDSYAFDVEIQLNQKILIAGSITSATGTKIAILRLDATGNFDNSFDANGVVTAQINNISSGANRMCLQPDQKILVVGGSNNKQMVMRFNTNGSIDSTFDADGYVLIDYGSTSNNGYDIALAPDGKIIPAGIMNPGGGNYDFALSRLNTDGSFDLSFSGDGKMTLSLSTLDDWCYGVAVQSDGKIVATGHSVSANLEGSFKTVRIISCATTFSTETASECLQYYWDQTQQTLTASGNYYVTYPNAEGCDSIITLNLTIYQLPNVSVTQTGNILTASLSGATYQWLDCNNNNDPIPGATNQTYVATTNGSYRVEITKNGCTDYSVCKTVTGVGINELPISDSEIQIYPNPTSGFINIQSENLLEKITVMDISGRKIFAEENISSKEISVDLSAFAEGIYLLQIVNVKGGIVFSKILKY